MSTPEPRPNVDNESPIERDDDRFQCPGCDSWMLDGDPENVRIGSQLICANCASKHPAIIGQLMSEILSDEQQDDFEQRRR